MSALIKGSAWTSVLCSFFSMEKMEWAYFLATGNASSIVDNPMFDISFTLLKRVFRFVKTVVFPFLTYSADACSATASERMTCSLTVTELKFQIGTNLSLRPCPECT